MPKVGPWLGWRMQVKTFFPRCAPMAWLSPTVVVVLPSPSGVGVIAVTTMYFPLGASLSRSRMDRCTLALFFPYSSSSSGRIPASSAIRSMGTGVAACAISRSLGTGFNKFDSLWGMLFCSTLSNPTAPARDGLGIYFKHPSGAFPPAQAMAGEPTMSLQPSASGLIHLRSPYSVSQTLARLETILRSKGIAILARIDHSGDAAKAGLKMPPTELLIFGNPKAGTPLMIASPSVAIDLPLKALVWQDGNGEVWLSYNSPDYLKDRHALPDDLVKNIAGIGPICEEAVRVSA